jgi:hypothetical protein
MNKLAGATGVSVAEILETQEPADNAPMSEAVHARLEPREQMVLEFEEDINRRPVGLPELEDQGDDDSTSESSDLSDGGEEDLEALERLLEGDEDAVEETELQMNPPLRQSTRHNAGVGRRDDCYEWNLMNLGVGEAIREFGDVASDACKAELQQLFVEKKALQPVKWSELNKEQRRKVIRSHMFLKEKYEDGAFVKVKARLVADGQMQDRTIYPDHSSPTVKTRSVMTCLKLAAMKGWGLTKIDIAGAYLCADIGERDKVFMLLDKSLSSMCEEWVPEVKQYLREDGKLVVKLDKALYGLIQSTKLWYRELSGFLLKKRFAVCPSDQCVFMKKMNDGKYIVALLYVDDILLLSELGADREWVCQILEDRYGKVTVSESERLPYLGMTIVKTNVGYEVFMKVYIEETIKLYGKTLREYVAPAMQKLFDVTPGSKKCLDSMKFHSVVAKLLYLGKRGRPDILMAVQFLCTRVKEPTLEDEKKLERVLGYLSMTKSWTRAFDRSPFERVTTYIDTSFATHVDGKGQSACLVMLGNTLVHESCRKQQLVTKNSTEAELVALADDILEGEMVEEFIIDLQVMMDDDFVTNVHLVYQDNQSTIALVKSESKTHKPRSKYFKVHQEYVKERLQTSELEIEYMKTGEMLADILTKPLTGEHFHVIAHVILGGHRYGCLSNRGAMNNKCGLTVERVASGLTGVSCANHTVSAKSIRF